MEVQTEIEVGGYILVAERLGPEWRRWYTAHSLGLATVGIIVYNGLLWM